MSDGNITRKIARHKARRRKHQANLLRTDLSLEEKANHFKGAAIQTAIINHLKELRSKQA